MNESGSIWLGDSRVPPLPTPNLWPQPPSLDDIYHHHCNSNVRSSDRYCCRRCSRRRRRRKHCLEEQIVRVLERERRSQSRKRCRNCQCTQINYCQQSKSHAEEEVDCQRSFYQGKNVCNYGLQYYNANNAIIAPWVNSNNYQLQPPIDIPPLDNRNGNIVAPINYRSSNSNHSHNIIAPPVNSNSNISSNINNISNNISNNNNSNINSNQFVSPINNNNNNISSSSSSSSNNNNNNNNSNNNNNNNNNIDSNNSSSNSNSNSSNSSNINSNHFVSPINNINNINNNNMSNHMYNANMFEANSSYYCLSNPEQSDYMVSPGLSSVDSGYAGSPMDAMAGLESTGSLMDAFDEADIENLLREMVGNNNNSVNPEDNALPEELGTGTGSDAGISTGTGSSDQVCRRAVVGVVEPRVVLKIPKRRLEKQNCLEEEEMSITRTLPDFFKKALGPHVDPKFVGEEKETDEIMDITDGQETQELCEIAQNLEKSDQQKDLVEQSSCRSPFYLNGSTYPLNNCACKEGNAADNEDNENTKSKGRPDDSGEPLSKRRRKRRGKQGNSKKKLMSNSESETTTIASTPPITSSQSTLPKTIFVEKEKDEEWHRCGVTQNCSFFTREKSRQILHNQCHVTPANLQCWHCKERQGSLRQLLRHQRISHHLHAADFECRICDKKVTDLGAHVKTKHQEAKNAFECTDCKKTFRHRHSLIRHMIKHRRSDKKCAKKGIISANTVNRTDKASHRDKESKKSGGAVVIQNALCLWPPGATLVNNNCNFLLANWQNAFLVDPFLKHNNNSMRASDAMEMPEIGHNNDEIEFIAEFRPQQQQTK